MTSQSQFFAFCQRCGRGTPCGDFFHPATCACWCGCDAAGRSPRRCLGCLAACDECEPTRADVWKRPKREQPTAP